MKVASECRKAGHNITAADVLQYRTINAIAIMHRVDTTSNNQCIPRAEEREAFEQSFAQERLWFLDQLHPGSTRYLMPCAVRLRGPLQVSALKAALLSLEQRQETLRTTFTTTDERNIQIIHPFHPHDIKVVQIPPDQKDALSRAVNQDQTTPFDLQSEPGWRVCVYRMNPEDHVLSMTMHHIISDGWSVDILRRELAELYAASIRGQDPAGYLEPLPVQYRDFSVWQRQQEQQIEHQKQLEYWAEQLATSRPAEFLCDKPRPATPTGRAGAQKFVMDGPLYASLQRFCRKHDVTPFVVLLAAFRATHFRLTGANDATIGVPNANRDRWELKDIIGFFVNIQAIRIRIEEESFMDLVRQVQATTVASLTNQDVPFEKIVSALHVNRDLERHPLTQIAFAFHSQLGLGQFAFDGVETEEMVPPVTTRFDVELHIFQEERALRGHFLFSTDLYRVETAENILCLFHKVLDRALLEPDDTVASMSLFTDDDHAALGALGLMQIQRTDYPRDSSIVDVFREQVAALPDKVAVRDSVMELTYTELDTRSEMLARWLASQSLSAESIVAVLAPRSCEAIIAFMGILKANLAYLPLDIQTPTERLELILSSVHGHRIVLIAPGVQAPSLQLSGISLDHKALQMEFDRHKVSSVMITPALLKQYLDLCPASIAGLRMICVAGDRADSKDLIQAGQLSGGYVLNAYGPTENTVTSAFFLFSPEELCTNGVPIGRAISNSGAYVMDRLQRLVPLGVVGELVVTGDGLARGYTDSKQDVNTFVTISIGGQHVRAYRTGDFVRCRPQDGQLEFFGRADGQVKIRGHRVELGEIENLLRSHQAVDDAAVVLQGDHGEKDAHVLAFTTIRDAYYGTDMRSIEDQEGDLVQNWVGQFNNDTYIPIDMLARNALGKDFVGWTSMYDGSEIEKTEMIEWLADTIKTLTNGVTPGHVLEIGSGTGMILFNLPEGLQSYVGIEPSERAVELLTQSSSSLPALANKVTMHKGTAADLGSLELHDSPELVVLNSVVQYFPSQEYLLKILQDVLRTDGVKRIFIGDVRSKALQRQFLVTRALHTASANATRAEIERIMSDMEKAESELLLDPGFFTGLLDRLPDSIEHVEILPKVVHSTNELSCYRYAAVMHVKNRLHSEQRVYTVTENCWIDFVEEGLSRQTLLEILKQKSTSSVIAVANIPHKKTIVENYIVDSLKNLQDGIEDSLEDSFFYLGGNSIAGMKVVAEARRSGFELSVADIFRHPRLVDMARQVRDLVRSSPSLIPCAEEREAFEQSFAQERLWFLDQLHPGSTRYLMPCAVRLRGPLQVSALKAALLSLEQRQETLRTTFTTTDERNIQIIHPFHPHDIKVVQIPPDQKDALSRAVNQDQTTPFDLQSEPGWRVCVYRMNPEDHVLSMTMHHIISDGWSVDILRRELAELYAASIRGQDPAGYLEPLPVQYRDFSVWQRQQEQQIEHQKQLEYWAEQLATSRPAEFLCDKPRPATPTGRAGAQKFVMDGPLYASLQRFCRKHDVTPFVVLLAAFRATHFRLTGANDATIGVPNANRDRWELKDIIGFFVNIQAIRIRIEEESFMDLVRQVQATTVASLTNQDVPFEKIVSALHVNRDLERHPLTQIAFAFHSQLGLGQFAFDGVETEEMVPPVTTRFDVELHIFQEERALRGHFLFSTDLYRVETAENILCLFHKVLDRALLEPDDTVASMSLFTDDDHAALGALGLMQIQRTDYPRDSSIVDVFREQVAALPDKVAVRDSVMELTYTELDTRSEMLARWLASQSLSAESIVAVLAPRSCEAIIAFMGILKANLAYLPLDVTLPSGRLETILSSVHGRKLVLLTSSVQPPTFDLEDVELVSIGGILANAYNRSGNLPAVRPSASSLAYVMFTSGSTGQPKGVMVEHRGIVRLVKESNMSQYLHESSGVAHISNLSFDASTWEIYASLLNGGTLVCIDTLKSLDDRHLQAMFRQYSVKSAMFTPALLKQYLAIRPSTISFEILV
ncbi:non-ribosomal peptide synthase [Purpureocillium lilacinum]|uniref:Non-ribosomal peptide synthase n=1 Tax=Purpureocillium lilacinum TaxID=33203 RepID=A0A179FBP0_PURLI|nr:non-ribosomal peptide synthase [Purpureocillium lilacinum]